MTLRSRSWVIDFNRCSGIAQVRRATLSCDSSYFFIQFNVPFVIISYEMRQSVGGKKMGEPREKQNHLTGSQAELGLSHMARAGFEPTLDTAVRTLGKSPIKWGQSPDMTIAVD